MFVVGDVAEGKVLEFTRPHTRVPGNGEQRGIRAFIVQQYEMVAKLLEDLAVFRREVSRGFDPLVEIFELAFRVDDRELMNLTSIREIKL